ncbi:hypothetical protein BY996DRAFT_4576959 [Phakopsora pachyrhizi]|nr:hypothetical protein BY996DRAFT_4576959 [Phakopsora pachyrhizi]
MSIRTRVLDLRNVVIIRNSKSSQLSQSKLRLSRTVPSVSAFFSSTKSVDSSVNNQLLLNRSEYLSHFGFKQLDLDDLSNLRRILNLRSGSVLSSLQDDPERLDQSELNSYNNDWLNKYRGKSRCVLKPKSTDEVGSLVSYCVKNRLPICPQGGNTGLVGGSVPVHDEIILSLAGLANIRSFDQTSGIVTVDAGCILQTVDEYLRQRGYLFPLDLGAKGSCQVGGNIATNAGGLRLLRYGSLHGSVLGLEVVLPDENGTILSSGMKNGLRKDNTGYDLKQLFIGSEGTLGIITGATVLTPKKSSSINVALIPVSSYTSLQKIFKMTRESLGEILSAFEFFDRSCFELVTRHSSMKDPFNSNSSDQDRQFYVLIETSGSNKEHDDQKLEGLMTSLLEDEIVSDGVLAQDESQLQSMWSFRELIPESASKSGATYKYDISLPIPVMYEAVEETRKLFIKHQMLAPDGSEGDKVISVAGYGHVGDGNLHLNVIAKEWDPAVEAVIEPWIYQFVSDHHGSISAEHGLGLMKVPYVGYSKDQSNLEVMRRIKKVFDPHRILNPCKYIEE